MSTIKDSKRGLQVASCIYFCSQALNDFKILSKKYYSKELQNVIGKAPFPFYKAALSNMISVEYCKLFEHSQKQIALSSIVKFKEFVHSNFPEFKVNKYLNDLYQNIEPVLSSETYKKIKIYRDKRFAHSDDDFSNQPFKIPLLKSEELDSISMHLELVFRYLNMVLFLEKSTQYINYPSSSMGRSMTENNLDYFAVSESFYRQNYANANLQGFPIR